MWQLVKNRHEEILVLTIACLALGNLLLFFWVKEAQAALVGGLAFGGRITSTVPCTCTGETLVYVSPPRGGSFIRSYFTRLFGRGRIMPGATILGLSRGFKMCLVTCPSGCCPVGGGLIMTIAGTN